MVSRCLQLKELVDLARNRTGNIDQFISNAGYADKKEFGEFNNDDLNRSVETMAISFSEIINASGICTRSCGLFMRAIVLVGNCRFFFTYTALLF